MKQEGIKSRPLWVNSYIIAYIYVKTYVKMNDKKEINPWIYDYSGDAGTGMVTQPTMNGVDKNEMNDAIKTAVDNLVGTAPETMDTLGEIADIIEEGGGSADALIELINKKLDKEEYEEDKVNFARTDEIPTKLSQLDNDSSFVTTSQMNDELEIKANVSDVYTKQESDNKFITEHQDLSSLATKSELESVEDSIPSNVSELENDANYVTETTLNSVTEDMATKTWVDGKGFLTEHQSLEGYVTQEAFNTGLDTKQDSGEYVDSETYQTLLSNFNSLTTDYNSLKTIVAALEPTKVTYEINTDSEFGSQITKNGVLKLNVDVTRTTNTSGAITASNNTTLNLNGHTVEYSGQRTATYGCMLLRGSQTLTIKGNGTLKSTEPDAILLWCASANVTVNIGGGTKTYYEGNIPGGELIYCESGTINITGGVFKNSGSPYLLNCKDANYAEGTAKIIVTGGKFYDFDPGNNTAEGENTSFLAEGYISVADTVTEEDGEHTVYTVKKAS